LGAGVGAGIFRELCETAKGMVKWERTFESNHTNHSQYVNLYKQWREVYRPMVEMVDDGLVQPMWRAAGT